SWLGVVLLPISLDCIQLYLFAKNRFISYTQLSDGKNFPGQLYIEITMTMPNSPTPVYRSGYTLTILRKESDGRWRIARDANLLTARENS
ncbi:MAG: hypothetical protein AB1798_23110, partial [Spirochaetota bacterium]